jgi:hypothetical protein
LCCASRRETRAHVVLLPGILAQERRRKERKGNIFKMFEKMMFKSIIRSIDCMNTCKNRLRNTVTLSAVCMSEKKKTSRFFVSQNVCFCVFINEKKDYNEFFAWKQEVINMTSVCERQLKNFISGVGDGLTEDRY